MTLQKSCRRKANTGTNYDRYQRPACADKPKAIREDAEVEEEYREFRAVNGELVEYLQEKETLLNS